MEELKHVERIITPLPPVCELCGKTEQARYEVNQGDYYICQKCLDEGEHFQCEVCGEYFQSKFGVYHKWDIGHVESLICPSCWNNE